MFERYLKNKKNSVENILASEKIPAMKAYMVSKYGNETTKEELLKEFFIDARELIQLKTCKHQYSAILEVNEDITEYLPQIVDHYKKYGYNIIVIDGNTNITNSYNEMSTRITMTFIILTWDNPQWVTINEDKNN